MYSTGTTTCQNTILAANRAKYPTVDLYTYGGTFTSLGNNVFGEGLSGNAAPATRPESHPTS